MTPRHKGLCRSRRENGSQWPASCYPDPAHGLEAAHVCMSHVCTYTWTDISVMQTGRLIKTWRVQSMLAEQLAVVVYFSGYGPRKFQAIAEAGGDQAKTGTMCHIVKSSALV